MCVCSGVVGEKVTSKAKTQMAWVLALVFYKHLSETVHWPPFPCVDNIAIQHEFTVPGKQARLSALDKKSVLYRLVQGLGRAGLLTRLSVYTNSLLSAFMYNFVFCFGNSYTT